MTSVTRDNLHRERVAKKHATLEGLKDLYASWEGLKDPDHEDMVRIRERIRKTEIQLTNMRP